MGAMDDLRAAVANADTLMDQAAAFINAAPAATAAAVAAQKADAARLAIQGCGTDRCQPAVSGVQLHGDALDKGEGEAATAARRSCGGPRAADRIIRCLLSYPARGIGSGWASHSDGGRERARG